MGFEPAIPGLERAKTFYALDRAATVIGLILSFHNDLFFLKQTEPCVFPRKPLVN
jgi:hypothetical protein